MIDEHTPTNDGHQQLYILVTSEGYDEATTRFVEQVNHSANMDDESGESAMNCVARAVEMAEERVEMANECTRLASEWIELADQRTHRANDRIELRISNNINPFSEDEIPSLSEFCSADLSESGEKGVTLTPNDDFAATTQHASLDEEQNELLTEGGSAETTPTRSCTTGGELTPSTLSGDAPKTDPEETSTKEASPQPQIPDHEMQLNLLERQNKIRLTMSLQWDEHVRESAPWFTNAAVHGRETEIELPKPENKMQPTSASSDDPPVADQLMPAESMIHDHHMAWMLLRQDNRERVMMAAKEDSAIPEGQKKRSFTKICHEAFVHSGALGEWSDKDLSPRDFHARLTSLEPTSEKRLTLARQRLLELENWSV